MNDKRYLFRGFYQNNDGGTVITLNGKKIRGEWVYGDLLHPDTEIDVGYSIEAIDKSKKNNCHEVIYETVGQWVKTDKNGKDVFVGDKAMFTDVFGHKHIGSVEYGDNGMYVIDTEDENIVTILAYAFEVIGTKWEVQE